VRQPVPGARAIFISAYLAFVKIKWFTGYDNSQENQVDAVDSDVA